MTKPETWKISGLKNIVMKKSKKNRKLLSVKTTVLREKKHVNDFNDLLRWRDLNNLLEAAEDWG
jgi:hypothetical protein